MPLPVDHCLEAHSRELCRGCRQRAKGYPPGISRLGSTGGEIWGQHYGIGPCPCFFFQPHLCFIIRGLILTSPLRSAF